MIRVIIVLAILAACAALGLLVKTLPYDVLIRTQDKIISIPLIYWVIISFITVWLLGVVFKTLLLIWRSPQILSRSSESKSPM